MKPKIKMENGKWKCFDSETEAKSTVSPLHALYLFCLHKYIYPGYIVFMEDRVIDCWHKRNKRREKAAKL